MWNFRSGLQELGFPRLAQLHPLCEHIFLGFLKILVNTHPLDRPTRAAARYKVGGAVFSAVRAGNHEIHGHDEGIFETGLTIQTAIPTAEMVAFQNFQAFGDADGHVHF
jgi:hypothetical protein